MNTFITQYNQNVLDLCLQIYGSLDYLSQLMSDNSLSISDYVVQGTSIVYNSSFIPNTVYFTTGILNSSYCGIVTDLSISNITTVTVGSTTIAGCTISWFPVSGATKYIYCINSTGIPPVTFTGTSVYTDSIVLTGLTININYFIYIATVCSNGSISNWSSLEFILSPDLFPPLVYIEIGYIEDGYFANN